MKAFLTFALCTILSFPTLAKNITDTGNRENDLSVKLNFVYQYNKTNYSIDADMRMPKDNNQWTIIRNEDAVQNDNILLLSKIEESDSHSATFAFLVIDTGKSPSVISNSKLVVAYGQEGKMGITGREGKMQFSVLAA